MEKRIRWFWALLASGQITMRKVDGWRSLNERPTNQTIDLAALLDNLVMLEIVSKSIPTQITTPPDTPGTCQRMSVSGLTISKAFRTPGTIQ